MNRKKINLIKNRAMKRNLFDLMMIAVIIIAAFTACTVTGTLNDDSDPPIPTGKKMTLVSNKQGNVRLEFSGSGKITIDWGDESENETFDNLGNTSRSHHYASGDSRTITIYGENIMRLSFPNSQVTSMDISENDALTQLDCNDNQLKTLNVNKNTALIKMDCCNNQLTALDVSKNTALKDLFCSGNQIVELDMKSNTNLTQLNCSNNKLKELDISKNTKIISLLCNNNLIEGELNTDSNVDLKILNCGDNKITGMNMTKNTKLETLFCSKNEMEATELTTLLGSLHDNGITGVSKEVYIQNNPGTATCGNKDVAANNGWTVID